jgi:hypothetical protein
MDTSLEELHLDQAIPNINWMENLYFGGLDDSRTVGFGVHLKMRTDLKRAEVRTFVEMGDDNAGFGGRYPLTGGFSYPVYTAECIEPFRHWRIKINAMGWPFGETGGFMGLEIQGRSPTTPFSFEIDIKSELAIGDWALFKGVASADAAGHGHYDQGISWSGTLRLGDKTATVSGLGIRDHSWGPRNFREMDKVWFTGVTYENCRAYFAGQALLDKDGWHGFSYLIEGDSVKLLPRPEFTVLSGEDAPGLYKTVLVTTEGVNITCHIKKHVLMPLLPERYLSGDGFALTETATGQGHALVERGLLYSPAEIEAIYASTGAGS